MSGIETIVLDPLPFALDRAAFFQILRVRPESAAAGECERLIDEAQAIGRPKAIYRLAFIDEHGPDYVVAGGVRFTSRILAVNLASAQRVFAYICTAGRELEAWAEGQTDMLARFWADRLNQAALQAAFAGFEARLRDEYRLAQTGRMNPGSLTDWPLGQQPRLFGLLGDVRAAIGVALTDSLLMRPLKSVSGLIFPTEESFASCQLCPRAVCPNRRAPYDPKLFERRFADKR
jgi:hypothetical protein